MSTTPETNLADAQPPATTAAPVAQTDDGSKYQLDAAGNPTQVPTQQITLQEEHTLTTPTQQRQPKLCGVCRKKESKYKCTRCELP